LEKVVSLFSNALENVRVKFGVSKEDFATFYRFETNPIHLLKADALAKARKGSFDPALLSVTAKEVEKNLGVLYEKFLNTKELYPSSVDEYATLRSPPTTNPCDLSGCSNIDFEDGNLSAWYGYYAENNSSATGVIINGNTGGLLGAVTEACNDPTVISYMSGSNSFGFRDTNLTTDYQISITSSGYDHIVPAISRVSPWGGSHSVMLGDSQIVGQGVAILSKTFLVSANTSTLTYQYAVFLNNPKHLASQQPFFIIAVLDENGDTIQNCGVYKVVSGYGIKGFDSVAYYGYDGLDTVYYRKWTLVNVPLKKYIGQCVTIVFEVSDCALGGHFGYAYVDAACSPSTINASSPNFCGQDSISLTAPPGATNYRWSGPANSILSGVTQQTAWVRSAGVYRVIMTPVTGVACGDTLYDTIGRLPGPPPKPDFYPSSTCLGQKTQFINTSTNIAGGDFYWDFYDIGIYNDTNVVNPTWNYLHTGTYNVKLHEIYKGCGNDTVIPVTIYGSVIGGFAMSPICAGGTATMTNTTLGELSCSWNYGDPASGASDSSSATNGSHTYITAGKYTITLTSKNGATCSDVTKQTITVYANPKPVISGDDSVCPNYKDVLTATGGTTYKWSTGATTSNIVDASAATDTLTVEAYSNICSHDTSFILHRIFSAPAIIASEDSICLGSTVILNEEGGSNYRWSTQSTASSISVTPNSNTRYVLYSTVGLCTDSAQKIIIVETHPELGIVPNQNICSGNRVTLGVNEISGFYGRYTWEPGGSREAVINVFPDTTTVYTVQYENKCGAASTSDTVFVKPAPTPLFKTDVTEGCAPLCIPFTDMSSIHSGNIVQWSWVFGNGDSSHIENPIYCYPNSGTFSVIHTAVADNGCSASLKIVQMITVYNAPVANFTYSPQMTSILEPTVQFTDSSTDAYGVVYRMWNFGDNTNSESLSKDLSHTYQDTGRYCPQLVVANDKGCLDTATNCLEVEPVFTLYIPSAFSPNGDGLNDVFAPKGKYIKSFEMYIFDRWGMELYHTTDINQGWNGTVKGGGAICQEDIYVYKILAVDFSNKQHSYVGNISLIK